MMTEEFDPKPPLDGLEAASAYLTGADKAILEQGPARDRSAVVTIFLIMVAVFVWQSIAFTFTAHMFLAAPSETRPELVAIAILFAAIILLTDGLVVIRSSWWFSGLDQLKRGGLVVPGYTAAKIKNVVLNVARIALALVPAELIALSVALFIFHAELGQVLTNDAVQRNAGLTRRITERDDADTGRMAENLSALQAGRTQAAANAEALRADALRVPADDPELAAVTARIPGLEAAKLEAERRLAAIPRTRLREDVERRAIAQRLLNARRADLEKAQGEQAALRQRTDATHEAHTATVAIRLKEATEAEAAYQDRSTPLAAELADRAAGRAERIRRAVEGDAAYLPPDHGILARLRALAGLSQEGWNLTLVLLLHAFFLGIELAAVLAKLLSAVPSSYAVRLAGEEYATEVETVDAVFKRIGSRGYDDSPAAANGQGNPALPPERGAANNAIAPADAASGLDGDMEDRLRDGAVAARAQATARARATAKGADKARDKPGDAATSKDVPEEMPNFILSPEEIAAGPVRRGPGRPPGAKNKSAPANDDRPSDADEQDVA